MKRISLMWTALLPAAIGVVLAVSLASAAPAATKKSFTFDVGSAFGDSDRFSFTIPEAGCILAQVKSWARSGSSGTAASQLALILTGSDRTTHYARTDGTASSVLPLSASYAAESGDVTRVKTWTISIGNFTRSGTARGTLELEYPATLAPCQLRAAASRTPGRVDLSWRYTGKSFSGAFLVERSTDGATWSALSACKKSRSTSTTSYACSDTGLRSGTRYYYRACTSTGTRCGTTNITPTTSARAP